MQIIALGDQDSDLIMLLSPKPTLPNPRGIARTLPSESYSTKYTYLLKSYVHGMSDAKLWSLLDRSDIPISNREAKRIARKTKKLIKCKQKNEH